jgi:hypothetical protein
LIDRVAHESTCTPKTTDVKMNLSTRRLLKKASGHCALCHSLGALSFWDLNLGGRTREFVYIGINDQMDLS